MDLAGEFVFFETGQPLHGYLESLSLVPGLARRAVTLSTSAVWKDLTFFIQQTVHVTCAILERGDLKEPSSQ